MKYKIPFIKPSFPDNEKILQDYDAILKANWYTNFGPYEREFAKLVGSYVGKEYFAATFSSATTGLIASVIAVLGKGDNSKYVIMPSFTFPAGAEALIWCGYKPMFIDIEKESLQMNIAQARTAIEREGKKIKAILFCNAFGVGKVNVEEWEDLSNQTDKPLIIDSAAGFGSEYNHGRKVGSAGTCEVFSFHATKPFAIGEGGAVVSKNEELIKLLKSIQNFGFNQSSMTETLGFNGKLQEFNAAIGLRQLETFDEKLKDRRKVFNKYLEGLNTSKILWQENAENSSLCFATAIVKDRSSRDSLLNKLRKNGVEARNYYSPSLHNHPYFLNQKIFSDLSTTDIIDESVISLPIHDDMKDQDVELILNLLK